MKLTDLLRETAHEDAGLGASPDVERALLAEYRSSHSARPRFWMGLAATAAAALWMIAGSGGRPPVDAAPAAFVPVGYAPPLEPGEIRQVVRVRLGREQLAAWGLVPMAASPEPVVVEVVVGSDTLVRAVRFAN